MTDIQTEDEKKRSHSDETNEEDPATKRPRLDGAPDSNTTAKDPDQRGYGVCDETEASLGISEYISPSVPGFSGVVKARYSDFLVHEIGGHDGSRARLTSLECPVSMGNPTKAEEDAPEPSAPKDSQGTPAKKEDDAPKPPPPEPTAAKEADAMKTTEIVEEAKEAENRARQEAELAELIKDPDVAKRVMVFMKFHDHHAADNGFHPSPAERQGMELFVALPALEKPQRKAVHEWVRNSLERGRADTLDGKIRIWHYRFETLMPNYQAFGSHKKRKPNERTRMKQFRKDAWPPGRPDYLRFVLYKENCDVTTAAKDLSRRGKSNRIGYAGMKDKRGITSQFCTMYRTLPEHIAQKGHGKGSGGGNHTNRGGCIVRVGNFEYTDQETRLGDLKGNRFDIAIRNVKLLEDDNAASEGPPAKRMELLEVAAKTMQDNGFINYFGTQRFGKFHNTHLVGIALLQGDYKKAVKIIMDPTSEERPDIAQARKDWQERFTYGETKANEVTTAKRVLKRLNRFMTAEIAILKCLVKNPFNYRRAFGCIPKNLRMMFVHAVQSFVWNRAASHRIAKMGQEVLVGDLVSNEGDSESKVHIVTEDDVEKKKFTLENVLVPVVGSKTIFPTNALGAVLNDLHRDLGLTPGMFGQIQDREIRATGDYRKMIIRPNDFTYSIQEYYRPLQPLLQTDLMKLEGDEIVVEPPEEDEEAKKEESAAPTPTQEESAAPTAKETKSPSPAAEEKESSPPAAKPLIAMVVGFSLPPSSYATIALRELMKSPTSNEFQRELKLS